MSRRKTLISECDRLWSAYVLQRDNHTCQRCHRNGRVAPHHIFSRRHMSTRHDPENGITLCFHCHIRIAHQEPEIFRSFIVKRLGQKNYDNLMLRAYSVNTYDLEMARLALSREIA